MYLKHVALSNIRSFHGERRVDLDLLRPDRTYAGWTVLAGRNGSGKTTLLRAIALAVSGPDVARQLVPDFESWMSRGARRATAKVEFAYAGDVDVFPADLLGEPGATFSGGLVWDVPQGKKVGDRPTLGLLRPRDADYDTMYPQRGPWSGDDGAGWFCAGYGPFRRLAGGSSEVQRLMRGTGPVSRLTSLFQEDASLAEGVSWLIVSIR